MPYIFGYGSLISASSRARTGQTGEAIPVSVSGLERGWYLPVPERKHCALAVIKKKEAQCNGVLIPVSEEELLKFDIRECEYDRLALPPANLQFYSEAPALIERELIIAYAVTERKHPTEECPIIQSYLDVIINGCLAYGEDYATDLLNSTTGWSEYFLNDRAKPRYVRAEQNLSTDLHDQLLKNYQPDAYALRKTWEGE